MTFWKPMLPAEQWREEREQIARKRPHLSIVGPDPRERQELWCERCNEPADADCWNPIAQLLICPRCWEEMVENGDLPCL